MRIKSVKNIRKLKGRKIFLRVDFNVPLSGHKIQDDYKIKNSLDTIKFLQERGARLIIASHLGRPDAHYDKNYSLQIIANRLALLLEKKIKFISFPAHNRLKLVLSRMRDGEIIMLDNLRFHPGEYSNDSDFAQSLADLADIYVNDAFAVSHRAQASVSAIKKYLPAYAGLLLIKELKALQHIVKARKPLVVVMGGSKIKTKAALISKIYPQAAFILIGGALANNFLKLENLEVGRSLLDKESKEKLKVFFKRKKLVKKIILPLDLVIKKRNGQARVVPINEVKKTDCIFDIGPKTIDLYARYIKKAQTLVWNGPLGKFEEKSFRHGTLAIASLISARSSGRAYGLVGGGETVDALKMTKMMEYVDWVSTAGGAMLSYLAGEEMPGLSSIVKK